MAGNGWRTVIINNHAKLSFSNNNLVVSTDTGQNAVPIVQIKALMLNSTEVSLTARLICELNNSNVKVIFCDNKHLPCCETTGYHNNNSSAGMIRSQMSWKKQKQEEVWTKIVKQKIMSQYDVLCCNHLDNADVLKAYADNIVPDNSLKSEAHAARIYFSSLYGYDFNRRTCSEVNAALNYGYSIIMSDVSRCISLHGYLTELGIQHDCASNPFNFSCDIMEPFRPLIDDFVYNNAPEEFDNEYKGRLIKLCFSQVKYGNRKMDLQTAIDMYVNDIINELSSETECIKELVLHEQV